MKVYLNGLDMTVEAGLSDSEGMFCLANDYYNIQAYGNSFHEAIEDFRGRFYYQYYHYKKVKDSILTDESIILKQRYNSCKIMGG